MKSSATRNQRGGRIEHMKTAAPWVVASALLAVIYGIVPPSWHEAGISHALLAALKSDNMLWRSHAQRLLVERGEQDVVPELKAMAADPAMDEIGIAGGAFHALWTLNGLGAADFETVAKALKHPAEGVRAP